MKIMNGHQWKLGRLLLWSIPLICVVVLVLYFVGVTFHVSPKYDALETEYKKLNLPSDWTELKQYRQETRDVFGWCQNFTEGPACPGLVTKYRAANINADPRQEFESILEKAGFDKVNRSENCNIINTENSAAKGSCSVSSRGKKYAAILRVQPEFIGLSSKVTNEVEYVWVKN